MKKGIKSCRKILQKFGSETKCKHVKYIIKTNTSFFKHFANEKCLSKRFRFIAETKSNYFNNLQFSKIPKKLKLAGLRI